MTELVKILIGDPANAINPIAFSKVAAKTAGGKVLYPRFEIYADTPVVHGEVDRVTVQSIGLTPNEEMLVMQELTECNGATGASARKFFEQKALV